MKAFVEKRRQAEQIELWKSIYSYPDNLQKEPLP
jgi:hypothetical protein